MMDLLILFKDIKGKPVFSPWRLRWNKKREKYDKVPINNRSTKNPSHWTPLQEALDMVTAFNAACAKKTDHLYGVGLALTWGIARGQNEVLIGFDFDDVDFAKFKPPFVSYWEKSPSGKGLRALAWVPLAWAARFKDSLQVVYPGCDHVEVYVGTGERFLTITGDMMVPKAKTNWLSVYNEIKSLSTSVLEKIAKWEGLKLYEAPRLADPDAPMLEAGTAIGLLVIKYSLPDKQRLLLEGKLPEGERSGPFMGLLLELMGRGHPDADILATLLADEALWAYLNTKRDGAEKAAQFAKEEVQRARIKYELTSPDNLPRLGAQLAERSADPAPAPAPVPAPSAFPVSLYDNAPGLVGDIAMWLLHASCAPRVEFAYACALSVMSCLIGPYITFGDDDGKVNLYIALVGGTGSGKTKALGAACKLLSYTDAKDRIQDFAASEAALRRQLNVTPNVLLRVDELAHKIDSFKDSANGSGLSRAVLGMYDGDRLPPKQYADDKKTLPAVEDPFVQIVGGTTAKIWDVLQTKHLEDGTLNRFIFVSLPEQAPYSSNRRASNKIDKTFKDRLNAFFRQSNRANLLGNQHVEHAPAVQAALEALGPVVYAKQQQPFGELYGRFTLHVEKIAVILAVGDGRMVTSMTDYAQALAFVEWSVANTYATASTELAGSAFEKSTNKVVDLLSRAGGKMRLRDVYKQLHRRKTEVEELLLTMEISGIIERTTGETHNTGKETEWVCLLAQNDDE